MELNLDQTIELRETIRQILRPGRKIFQKIADVSSISELGAEKNPLNAKPVALGIDGDDSIPINGREVVEFGAPVAC